MKKLAIYIAGIVCIAFTSCIDKETYEAKLPIDSAITNPDPNALPLDTAKKFLHPGCMAVQADFDRAKKHVAAKEEPWVSAFTALTKSTFFNRNQDLTGRLFQGYLIRGGNTYDDSLGVTLPNDNFDFEYQNMSSAYSKAVYWKLTGDTKYADEAVTLLNSWAKNCKGVKGDPNKYLCLEEAGYDFASVAELMSDYTGWKAEDQTTFKQWIQALFIPSLIDFLDNHNTSASKNAGATHYWSNWDLMAMRALMAIGIYLDRPELYNKAIHYVSYGIGNGNFYRFINYIHPAISGEDDIDLGQTQEAGRDQGHNLLSIRVAADICRMAWNQGDDLYGFDHNRILKAAEFVAKYNYGPMIEEQQHLSKPLTYPFHALVVNADGNYHTENSTEGRGLFSSGFVSIYEHYKKYKKLETRYVKWAAKTPLTTSGERDLNADITKQVLIEPETYNHNQGAGSSFGTLLFTEDESILK